MSNNMERASLKKQRPFAKRVDTGIPDGEQRRSFGVAPPACGRFRNQKNCYPAVGNQNVAASAVAQDTQHFEPSVVQFKPVGGKQ